MAQCPSFPVTSGNGGGVSRLKILVPSTQLQLMVVKEECGPIVARSSDFLKDNHKSRVSM